MRIGEKGQESNRDENWQTCVTGVGINQRHLNQNARSDWGQTFLCFLQLSDFHIPLVDLHLNFGKNKLEKSSLMN